MANTKKFAVKNGLATPAIDFVSPAETSTISATMLDSGQLSVSGTSGQLFSISDSMTGSIFSVNDVSGIPSIEVFDTGKVQVAETVGNLLVGSAVDDGVNKVQITGKAKATDTLTITKTWNAADGSAGIYLNGTTGNRIEFGPTNGAPPSLTTRSAGTRIVLHPLVSGTQVDFGIGIDSYTMWNSAPDTSCSFKWYHGTTNTMNLSWTGLGIGTTPSARLHSVFTGEQLRLGYDATHYIKFTTDSSGNTVIGTAAAGSAMSLLSSGVLSITSSGASASYAAGIKFNNTGYKHYTIGTKGNYFVVSDTSSAALGWDTPTDRLIIGDTTLTYNGNNIYVFGNSTLLNQLSSDLFNNSGEVFTARTSFDASTASYGFGWRYVSGSTNGPGTNSATQYYSLYTGLGSQFPATGGGSHGMYLAIPRNATGPYLSVRYNENNSLTSWTKISAGYADVAGSVTGALNGTLGATTPNSISATTINASGTVQLTKGWSTTDGEGTLFLNGATGNRIEFNQNGVNAPTFNTRSAGTKLLLWSYVGSSTVDYAIGMGDSTLWFSVPQVSSQNFKWYGGTTEVMTLGSGYLGINTPSPEARLHATGTGAQLKLSYDGTFNTIFTVNSSGQLNIAPYNNGQVGINVSSPSAKLHVTGTSEQLRLGYDATKYTSFTTDSNGNLTIAPSGTATTVSSGLVANRTWNAADAAGSILLNGATGNRIDFNANGVAAPAYTTRSAGTKIVLYPGVAAAAVDFALGIESGTLWQSVTTSVCSFKWYHGTSNTMSLSNTALTAPSFVKSGGTSSQFLKADGSVDSMTYQPIYSITRTLPTTVGNYVEIGNFSILNGGHSFNISITISSVGVSISKTYSINTQYAAVATWKTVNFLTSSGAYSGQDFELEIMQDTYITYLRIRRTAGTTAGTANINIQNTGLSTDVFTGTTGTGVSTTSGYYGGPWQCLVGGGPDKVFVENDNTITTDYTITTNKNAGSTGPITINTGATVTVNTGSYWIIN